MQAPKFHLPQRNQSVKSQASVEVTMPKRPIMPRPTTGIRNGTDDSNLTYEQLRDKLFSEGRLFDDPKFPASEESLGNNMDVRDAVTDWKRPSEIITTPPFFFKDGVGRFGVKQGELGNCWFLAALACLTQHQELVFRVAPADQGFTEKEKYCGLFRFNFWNDGKWKEVLVDDRLPVRRDKKGAYHLVFMQISGKAKFWTPLLEKAYAKLMGSYSLLDGGKGHEAMKDFTGGLVLMYENLPKQDNLYEVLVKARQRQSLLACGTAGSRPGEREQKMENGLFCGHAYSITELQRVKFNQPGSTKEVELVRVRNPHGDGGEWNGAWSDRSREWNFVSEDEKRRVQFTCEDDGEFWMPFSEFVINFDYVDVCFLTPTSANFASDKAKWDYVEHHGSWIKNINAGGNSNHRDTFWTNPQYRVTVVDADKDGFGTLFIGLMQKKYRKALADESQLVIGYAVYKVNNTKNASGDKLGKDFFMRTRASASTKTFVDSRDVTNVHHMVPGEYVIVPSTFEPNCEGEFILRIVAESSPDCAELKVETKANEDKLIAATVENTSTILKRHSDDELYAIFHQWANPDGKMDSFGLRGWLDSAFREHSPEFQGFTPDCVSGLVALNDMDMSGKLDFEEFKEVWIRLNLYKEIFNKYDANRNGTANLTELREMLSEIGYQVGDDVLKSMVSRYGDASGEIYFHNFVASCVRLQLMCSYFKIFTRSNAWDLDFFLKNMMLV